MAAAPLHRADRENTLEGEVPNIRLIRRLFLFGGSIYLMLVKSPTQLFYSLRLGKAGVRILLGFEY